MKPNLFNGGPWWLDYGPEVKSDEEVRAKQTIVALWVPMAFGAIAVVQWIVASLGIKGGPAVVAILVIACPPTAVIAKWIAQSIRPELFELAERNWRKRNIN